MSVYFDLELGEAIRKAADEASLSVSAWLAQAAQARLKHKALGEFIAAWEEEFGEITDEELEEARADFARAKEMARKKAARRDARP